MPTKGLHLLTNQGGLTDQYNPIGPDQHRHVFTFSDGYKLAVFGARNVNANQAMSWYTTLAPGGTAWSAETEFCSSNIFDPAGGAVCAQQVGDTVYVWWGFGGTVTYWSFAWNATTHAMTSVTQAGNSTYVTASGSTQPTITQIDVAWDATNSGWHVVLGYTQGQAGSPTPSIVLWWVPSANGSTPSSVTKILRGGSIWTGLQTRLAGSNLLVAIGDGSANTVTVVPVTITNGSPVSYSVGNPEATGAPAGQFLVELDASNNLDVIWLTPYTVETCKRTGTGVYSQPIIIYTGSVNGNYGPASCLNGGDLILLFCSVQTQANGEIMMLTRHNGVWGSALTLIGGDNLGYTGVSASKNTTSGVMDLVYKYEYVSPGAAFTYSTPSSVNLPLSGPWCWYFPLSDGTNYQTATKATYQPNTNEPGNPTTGGTGYLPGSDLTGTYGGWGIYLGTQWSTAAIPTGTWTVALQMSSPDGIATGTAWINGVRIYEIPATGSPILQATLPAGSAVSFGGKTAPITIQTSASVTGWTLGSGSALYIEPDIQVSNLGVTSASGQVSYVANGSTLTLPAASVNYTGSAGPNPAPWYYGYTVSATPGAPGIVSGSGNVSTTTPTLAWSYNNAATGDPQGAYEVQVSRTSDNLLMWNSGKVSGSAISTVYGQNSNTSDTGYHAPAALSYGTEYTWIVSTWDSFNNAQSPWSANTNFTPLQAPTVSIPSVIAGGQSVSAGGNVGSTIIDVELAYTQSSNDPMASYQLALLASDGKTVLTQTQSISLATPIPTGQMYTTADWNIMAGSSSAIVNGGTYYVQATVVSKQGLTATAMFKFVLNYAAPPAVLNHAGSVSSDNGSAAFSWYNPSDNLIPNGDVEQASTGTTTYFQDNFASTGMWPTLSASPAAPTASSNVLTIPTNYNGTSWAVGYLRQYNFTAYDTFTLQARFYNNATTDNPDALAGIAFLVTFQWANSHYYYLTCDTRKGGFNLVVNNNGTETAISSASFTAPAGGQWLWLTLQSVVAGGQSTITATLSTDSSGAVGSQIGTAKWVSTALAQAGGIGIQNQSTYTATSGYTYNLKLGGLTSGAGCTLTGPAPTGWSAGGTVPHSWLGWVVDPTTGSRVLACYNPPGGSPNPGTWQSSQYPAALSGPSTMTYRIRTPDGFPSTATMVQQWLNSSGTNLRQDVANPTPTSGYTLQTLSCATPPSGTVNGLTYMYTDSGSSGTVYWDKLQLETGSTATAFRVQGVAPIQTLRTSYRPAANSYLATALDSQPDVFYQLAETSGTTAVDQVAGNNGTYGGTYTQGQPGPIANGLPAVAFSGGSTSYVTCPDLGNLALGPFTVEFWMHTPAGTPVYSAVIGNNNGSGGDILWGGDGNLNHLVVNLDTHNSFSVVLGPTGQSAWYHIALTFDGAGSMSAYLNGAFYTTQPHWPVWSGPWSIGGQINGSWTGNNFAGEVADVAIYPYALPATTISSHYAARLYTSAAAASPWTQISNDYRAGLTFFPPMGLPYDYAIQAVSAQGGVSTRKCVYGLTLTPRYGALAWWLNSLTDPVNQAVALGAIDAEDTGTTDAHNKAIKRWTPNGRSKPITLFGLEDWWEIKGRKSILVDPPIGWTGPTAAQQLATMKLMEIGNSPLLYRDPDGTLRIVVMQNFSHQWKDVVSRMVIYDLEETDAPTTLIYV